MNKNSSGTDLLMPEPAKVSPITSDPNRRARALLAVDREPFRRALQRLEGFAKRYRADRRDEPPQSDPASPLVALEGGRRVPITTAESPKVVPITTDAGRQHPTRMATQEPDAHSLGRLHESAPLECSLCPHRCSPPRNWSPREPYRRRRPRGCSESASQPFTK